MQTSETAVTQRIDLRQLFPEDRVLSTTKGLYDFQFLKENKGELNDMMSFVDAARRVVGKAVNDGFLIRTQIILLPDSKTMMHFVGDWAENSTAVAITPTNQILVNCNAIRKIPDIEVLRTLSHEFAHLYIGIRLQTQLPRWLNEGLAMRIAGNGSIEDNAILAWAVLLKQTIPLQELENEFPRGANRQQLAYAEALSVTDYVLRTEHNSSVPRFIEKMSGQVGIGRVNLYYHPDVVDDIEKNWKNNIDGVKAVAGATFNDSAYWLVTLLLCILAWFSLLRKRKKQRAIWMFEEEEALRKLRLANEQNLPPFPVATDEIKTVSEPTDEGEPKTESNQTEE